MNSCNCVIKHPGSRRLPIQRRKPQSLELCSFYHHLYARACTWSQTHKDQDVNRDGVDARRPRRCVEGSIRRRAQGWCRGPWCIRGVTVRTFRITSTLILSLSSCLSCYSFHTDPRPQSKLRSGPESSWPSLLCSRRYRCAGSAAAHCRSSAIGVVRPCGVRAGWCLAVLRRLGLGVGTHVVKRWTGQRGE